MGARHALRPPLLGSLLISLLVSAAGGADPWYTLPRTDPLTPLPNITLQKVEAVGVDVGVTLDWPIGGEPLPPGAHLRLLDGEGETVGTADFMPLLGSQTVWIPGGALPRVGESAVSLFRYVELLATPSREILLETGVAVPESGEGRPIESKPRRPATWGRVCVLRVDYLHLIDPEDKHGDEPEVRVPILGARFILGEKLHGTVDLPMNWSLTLCDTCRGIDNATHGEIELWDLDEPGPWLFDDDDHLGTEKLNGCYTTPWKTVKFTGSNYNYDLVYQMYCVDAPCAS